MPASTTTEPDAARVPGSPVVSRRTLTAGAVWLAPVVAVGVAAPAYAASCGPSFPALIDWGVTSYVRMSATSGRATVTPSGGVGNVTVDFTSTFNRYSPTTDFEDANLQVHPNSVGALGQQGLAFFQTRNNNANDSNTYGQTVVIDFNGRPVTNLSFTLTDIDSSSGNYTDNVGFSVAPTSFQLLGTNLQGTGTYSSPFRKTGNNFSVGGNNSGGNVSVTFAGPLTTLTMKYWNSQATNQQVVYIADMSFSAKEVGCA